jgi:hypothetical protein
MQSSRCRTSGEVLDDVAFVGTFDTAVQVFWGAPERTGVRFCKHAPTAVQCLDTRRASTGVRTASCAGLPSTVHSASLAPQATFCAIDVLHGLTKASSNWQNRPAAQTLLTARVSADRQPGRSATQTAMLAISACDDSVHIPEVEGGVTSACSVIILASPAGHVLEPLPWTMGTAAVPGGCWRVLLNTTTQHIGPASS